MSEQKRAARLLVENSKKSLSECMPNSLGICDFNRLGRMWHAVTLLARALDAALDRIEQLESQNGQ